MNITYRQLRRWVDSFPPEEQLCILRILAHSVGLVTVVDVLSDIVSIVGVDCHSRPEISIYLNYLAEIHLPLPIIKRVIYNKNTFIKRIASIQIKDLTKI